MKKILLCVWVTLVIGACAATSPETGDSRTDETPEISSVLAAENQASAELGTLVSVSQQDAEEVMDTLEGEEGAPSAMNRCWEYADVRGCCWDCTVGACSGCCIVCYPNGGGCGTTCY